VVSRHLHDRAERPGGRDPEAVVLSLHDERGHPHRVEFRQPARRRLPARAAGRPQREGETEHADRAGRVRGAARDPRAERTSADDEREAGELALAESLDDRRPDGVELSRRRAESVRQALIERGVPAERLEARGVGFLAPVASNATEAGRALNRRVELVLR